MKRFLLLSNLILFGLVSFSQGNVKNANQIKKKRQPLSVPVIKIRNTEFKKTKDGFPYKLYTAGSGNKIAAGNVITIHTTTKLGDSLLGTTYGQGPQMVPIPKEGPNLDMMRFFFDARKGDSILLLQPIDSILAKNPMASRDSFLTSNKGKNIETLIKIVDVFKDQETMVSQQKAKDEIVIAAYLKGKSIQTKRSPKGVYIQTLTPGDGTLPKTGQVMEVRYSGKLLNGTEFDSNNKPGAALLPVTFGEGGVIPGFEDGLRQLSRGEKAVLYIPSALAYGAQAPPAIGPNQNLMFEIEVVAIKDQKLNDK